MQIKNLLAGFALSSILVAPSLAHTGHPTAKPTAFTIDAQKSTMAWHGKKLTGEHRGTINISKGNLIFDGKKLVGGTLEVDMRTIKDTDLTDEGYNKKLTGHLMSEDFFNVEQYPAATLKITKVTLKSGNDYDITGDLTIRDKTNPVSFPATVTMNGGTATVSANVIVDRSKYNVKYNSKSFFPSIGDKVVYDEFDLTANLVATK